MTNFKFSPRQCRVRGRQISKKGFTLIEMLIAALIFIIVVSISLGVFVSIVKAQRHNLVYQELLSQTSYSLEYMSRFLRMAKKDAVGACIDIDTNYMITRGGKGIKFQNYKGECQEFFLDVNTKQLKVDKDGFTGILPLTSDDFEVNSAGFGVLGDTADDNIQPRAIFFLEIKGKNLDIASAIRIQTVVSQRNLDI